MEIVLKVGLALVVSATVLASLPAVPAEPPRVKEVGVSAPASDRSAVASKVASVASSTDPTSGRFKAPVGHRQPRLQDLPLVLQLGEDRLARKAKRLDRTVSDSVCSRF
jgi:hypothetical protein